jgi:outer membrane protein
MKKGFSKLAIAWILSLGTLAFAGDLKIAHVDSKIVFEKYTAAAKQKKLMEMKDRLEKQSLMLSEEKKKELEADFLKEKGEYEQFVQKVYGREGDLFQENEKFSGPIITKIKKTVQDVAGQEGYDMVFDRAADAVVFWKKDNDLTQKVVDVLNKEAK